MTNITLSIDDKVHKRMRAYPEITWSTFVRNAIEKRLSELERIDSERHETLLTMLASQAVLAEDWNSAEDDVWDTI